MEINTRLTNSDKNTICRICMRDNTSLFPIFNEILLGDNTFTVAEIITECTKYPVAQNDQLPAQMCNTCMEAARKAHRFKRQAEKAYCLLKALYDITWVPKQWNSDDSKSDVADVRMTALTTEKYTQTGKSTVFECEICRKKFFDKNEIRQHRAASHIHDGKKCRVCGKTFNYWGQLRIHLSTEHPSEGIRCDFKCNVCSREFSRKDHLKRHLKRMHKIEDDKFNTSKVTLDEPEIENPTDSLNNYIGEPAPKNATIIDTNPFCSEDEGLDHHNFEDVKQCVETIAHHEISIKIEKPDYSNNVTKYNKEIKINVEELKPEKIEDNMEMNENKEDKGEDKLNNSFKKLYSNNSISEYDSHEDYDDEDDEDEPCNKPNKSIIVAPIKQKQTNEQTENTTSPTCNMIKKTNVITTLERRRHDFSENQNNRCKECNRNFTRYNHLVGHMMTHKKTHVCNICGNGFSRSDHLQKHMKNIHSEKHYKCDQCSTAFGRKDHLQRHIETRHNKYPTVQKPYFDCDTCEKKFTTKTYLAKHKLLHTDRLYACKHCTETFSEKEQMEEHKKKKHVQPLNFLCNICGDSFQRSEYLKIHIRRHTGEKPYKCHFCEKCFPRGTDLKVHERYHIGHKPNVCNLCGRGFHRQYNLNIHMRTHTGEKPYKCSQCAQAFAQSHDLKAHIRRHTGERFRCDMCSAAFLKRSGLNAHLRTIHGIKVSSINGRLRKAEDPMKGCELLEQQPPALPAQSTAAGTT